MNREILKAKIAEAISSTNTSGNEKLEAILAAVDTYSSAGNGTKPLVSGSLPKKCTCERCTGIKLESYYKDDDDGNDR